MRFMKGIRGASAPENEAFSTRLDAVTSRGKIEVSKYTAFEGEPPHSHGRKRFWSPGELPE